MNKIAQSKREARRPATTTNYNPFSPEAATYTPADGTIFARSKRNPAVYSPKFQYLASTMAEQKRVMISSTARDLPEHRKKVMDACMRLGMFSPDMMEHLTATDANALEVSLGIADRADLYVGEKRLKFVSGRSTKIGRHI